MMKCMVIITQFMCLSNGNDCWFGVTSTPPMSVEACVAATDVLEEANQIKMDLGRAPEFYWKVAIWNEKDAEGEDE